MKWLAKLLRPPRLEASARAAVEAYLSCSRPNPAERLLSTRFVVADVETSGLNPARDRLISIGAVTIEQARARLDSSFEVILRQPAPSATRNILVHQIDGTTQMSGRDPAEALADFLRFAGKSTLVGYHAAFDRAVIARAMQEFLGIRFDNQWLDLAVLAPALLPERRPEGNDLDDWLTAFGIDNYARHDAVADAVATAELFLVALSAALRRGEPHLADLISTERGARWLGIH